MTEKFSPVSIIVKNITSGERTVTFRQDIITIGRAPTCDVVLPDAGRNISSHHAVILKVGSGYLLKDTSRNGTRRENGSVMSNGMSVALSDGDEFEIIGYKIVFLSKEHTAEEVIAPHKVEPSKDINTLLKDIVGAVPRAGKPQTHHLPSESVEFPKLPHFSNKTTTEKSPLFFTAPPQPQPESANTQPPVLDDFLDDKQGTVPPVVVHEDLQLRKNTLVFTPVPEDACLPTSHQKAPAQGDNQECVGVHSTDYNVNTQRHLTDLGNAPDTMRSVAAVCLTLHSLFEKKNDSEKGIYFPVLHRFLRGEAVEGEELVKAIQATCDQIVSDERARQSVVMGAFRNALALVRPKSLKSRAKGVMGSRLFRSEKSMLWDFFEKQDSEIMAVAEQEFIRQLQHEDQAVKTDPPKRTPLLRRVAGVVVPLALLSHLAGCGGPSPTRLNLTIQTTAQVNPNSIGRPSPVVIRIFNLANDDEFQTSSFDALYRNNAKGSDSFILGSEEYEIAPASSRHINMVLPEGTKNFGMIAAFRQIDHATWRLVAPLRLHRKNKIDIIVGPSTILLNKKR